MIAHQGKHNCTYCIERSLQRVHCEEELGRTAVVPECALLSFVIRIEANRIQKLCSDSCGVHTTLWYISTINTLVVFCPQHEYPGCAGTLCSSHVGAAGLTPFIFSLHENVFFANQVIIRVSPTGVERFECRLYSLSLWFRFFL